MRDQAPDVGMAPPGAHMAISIRESIAKRMVAYVTKEKNSLAETTITCQAQKSEVSATHSRLGSRADSTAKVTTADIQRCLMRKARLIQLALS